MFVPYQPNSQQIAQKTVSRRVPRTLLGSGYAGLGLRPYGLKARNCIPSRTLEVITLQIAGKSDHSWNKIVLRYLSPVSGNTTTISLPLFSERLAT